LTQVLTGHGCFGKYLRQIDRGRTTACHHCDILYDTAQHTLADCEEWCEQRRTLWDVAEEDLSLSVLVIRVAGSEQIWRTVVHFCEEVMLQKETAERIRRQEAALPAPAGAAAAVATATRRRRETAGGAPTTLPSLRPDMLEGAEGWRCARGGPYPPHRGDEIKGVVYNNVGITPTRIPPSSIPLAQVSTHGMARNWVEISPSLCSRRHIGDGRSEGAEAPSGPNKKGRCKKQGENLPPPSE